MTADEARVVSSDKKMADVQQAAVGEQRKNFFNTVQHNFPDVINGKINTTNFLQASRDLVVLIDKFGKVFSPVTYDLTKNIEKISARFLADNQKFEDLQDMVLIEKESNENFIADALLWLRRGIHMMYLFFRAINDDFYEGKRTEDLAPFLRKAYESTLEPFHGWMAQQLFSILSRFCPTRTDLMLILSIGEEIHDESVMLNMKEFIDKLQSNVDELVKFYALNNLESTLKV